MAREHLSPNDIIANRKSTRDRATYLGTIDHPDNTKVRSAIGLRIGVRWLMEVVDAIGGCWNGAPDRCTYPTSLFTCPDLSRKLQQ
jgi:hypothetical protein